VGGARGDEEAGHPAPADAGPAHEQADPEALPTVLRLEHGELADIAAFEQPAMFAAFGLPAALTGPR
jgi:hypothetical protein